MLLPWRAGTSAGKSPVELPEKLAASADGESIQLKSMRQALFAVGN